MREHIEEMVGRVRETLANQKLPVRSRQADG